MHDDMTSVRSGARIQGAAAAKWDTAYEWQSILLLSLGFGLVTFDRYLIFPMFPVIMAALKLDYTDLGKITGALSISWGLSAFVAGRLADRIGRKRTMVTAMTAFSLLVGLSGLATGAFSLILIRIMMGAAEGAYAPPSLVTTMEAAKPSRQGFALGFYQMIAPILGFAMAPILVTQLIRVIDWRYIFLVASPPGLIIALLLWRTVREPAAKAESRDNVRLRDLLKHRNVALAAFGMLAWLNALVVLAAFLPSYLMDMLKLPIPTMGYVMSAVGVGGIFGSVGIPALSDRLGRKPCAIVSVIAAAGALLALSRTGADAGALFLGLMVAAVFLSGLVSLTAGPLAIESVPVHLRATASGAVIAVGELFGGGVAPVVAGYSAHHFGIASIFDIAIGGLVIGLAACVFLHESAPSKRPKTDG